MISKDFRIILVCLVFPFLMWGQYSIQGVITDQNTGFAIADVEVYARSGQLLAVSNSEGFYQIQTATLGERNKLLKVLDDNLELIFFYYAYEPKEVSISLTQSLIYDVSLKSIAEALSTVELSAVKKQLFTVRRLADVDGMAIYAGKKNEVIQIDNILANTATNNARQVYSQISGLNIFQNDDAGLQLNIGGRGLDPNRTSNFNTRQNGYDISADVLGYPESYYTPPVEALSEIQIVRGAASLQYGTQFGGLVNFKLKSPHPTKPMEVVLRNTLGSNNLYTNFTSLSGTKDKLSYYSFFNFKKGDGFRPNSNFESKNAFLYLGYKLNQNTQLSTELTYLNYLAQQAGGLNDFMFANNPYQSNRSRNWFEVNWLLYNVRINHEISSQTRFDFNFFGLHASRNALGFRTNRVDQPDAFQERDLIKGVFDNYGFESRLIHNFSFFNKNSTALVGAKFYKANNSATQGPGSNGEGADFNFQNELYIDYPAQSSYNYPNLNTALFAEQLIYLNDRFSITPGIRLEHIKTESTGYNKTINLDAAGNVILNETNYNAEVRERSFALLGLGTSFKPNASVEIYNNISQNYRSVTFADISIINPAFEIDPEITDEKGYNVDMGIRGVFDELVNYDFSIFGLFYNKRIGLVPKVFPDGNIKSERSNVGNAVIYGLESLVDFNISNLLKLNSNFSSRLFFNTSIIESEYTSSQANGIEGNKVEFVPTLNFKTGFSFNYQKFSSSLLYSFVSQQYTDASNAVESNLSGVVGSIPAYDVLDLSLAFDYKSFTIETGVHNMLDEVYFTRRATGYPGPGIIPSPPRNYYFSVQYKF